jgi:hypothetical protein
MSPPLDLDWFETPKRYHRKTPIRTDEAFSTNERDAVVRGVEVDLGDENVV